MRLRFWLLVDLGDNMSDYLDAVGFDEDTKKQIKQLCEDLSDSNLGVSGEEAVQAIHKALQAELVDMSKIGLVYNYKEMIKSIGRFKYYIFFWNRRKYLAKEILRRTEQENIKIDTLL
jgi:hypothetical protein